MSAAEDARDHGPRTSGNHRLHEVASFRASCMALCGGNRPSRVQKPTECATCAPVYFRGTAAESWGMAQGPPSPDVSRREESERGSRWVGGYDSQAATYIDKADEQDWSRR
jgi:hypothetical protein